MAEVVVSTLLVGLVLVSSMRTIGGVIRTWQVTDEQHDGMALATEMMSEILQARYTDPETPFGGMQLDSDENSSPRTDYDDTDDYNGWSASPPETRDGTELTDFNDWTRAVDVQKVDAGDPGSVLSDGAEDEGLRKITVTVTAPDNTQTVLIALRAQLGAMEQAPSVKTTYVVGVGSELQIGAGTTALRAGTNITNHAVDQ